MTKNIKEILDCELVTKINKIIKLKLQCEYYKCGSVMGVEKCVFLCKNCGGIMCDECLERSGKYCLNCMNDVHECHDNALKYICYRCGSIICEMCSYFAHHTLFICCENCR